MRLLLLLCLYLTACGAGVSSAPAPAGPRENQNAHEIREQNQVEAAPPERIVRVRTGEQTQEPVPSTSNSADVQPGTLSPELIRRVLRRHLNEVRGCYEAGLSTEPGLAGRVTMSFVVATDGHVARSEVSQSRLAPQGRVADSLERCLSDAILTWAFPSPEGGGGVLVNYPLVLDTRTQQ